MRRPRFGSPASDPTVNALEASGQARVLLVRIVGANGQIFSGESNSAAFLESIPAIRYFSDVNRGAVGVTIAPPSVSPRWWESPAHSWSGPCRRVILQSRPHFDFVRANNFIFQVPPAGTPISKVQQAVAPPWKICSDLVILRGGERWRRTARRTVTLTAIPQIRRHGRRSHRQHVHLPALERIVRRRVPRRLRYLPGSYSRRVGVGLDDTEGVASGSETPCELGSAGV